MTAEPVHSRIEKTSSVVEGARRAMRHALFAELHVGLTFARLARGSRGTLKRDRNQKNCRNAYDALLRLRDRARLGREDQTALDEGIVELKAALQELTKA